MLFGIFMRPPGGIIRGGFAVCPPYDNLFFFIIKLFQVPRIMIHNSEIEKDNKDNLVLIARSVLAGIPHCVNLTKVESSF